MILIKKNEMKILKWIWEHGIVIIAIFLTVMAIIMLLPEITSIVNYIFVQLILIAIFGFLFYLFNELEDKSTKSRWNKYRKFLNTAESSNNKWFLDEHGRKIPAEKKWYYFGVIPHYKERFYLSSTILVFLTDGEHLFQFLKMRFIELAILFLSWEAAIAWIIGKSIMSFIKEKFLNWLN